MDYFSVMCIGVGLSMDAFAVAVSNGAVSRKVRLLQVFRIAFFFGLFQAVMPVIGWIMGKAGEDIIKGIDHWIAFILLGYIGIKMIYGALKDNNTDNNIHNSYIKTKTLILFAIATSIDALATGIILPYAANVVSISDLILSVCIIGLITFSISVIGVYIGKKFGEMLSSKAEIFGGIVLIFIGTKILIEHLFF